MDEIWLPVNIFPLLYEVSNLGRLRRVRTETVRNGRPYVLRPKILKTRPDSDNKYMLCDLGHGEEGATFLLHRIVAEAFLAPDPLRPDVNHMDGCKKNNRASNLEWMTKSENAIHSYRKLNRTPPGKGKFGKDNKKSRVIIQTTDGEGKHTWYGSMDIQRSLGYDQSAIHKACKRGFIRYGSRWQYG